MSYHYINVSQFTLYFTKFVIEFEQIYDRKDGQPLSEHGLVVMDKWIH
jgi:hypothetical protein